MLTFIFRHPVMLLIGVALIALALTLIWRKHHLLMTGHMSDGKVVQLIPHRGSKGGISYSLLVDYTRPDGNKSQFDTRFATSPPLHALGETVRVISYDAGASPDILGFSDLYLFPWILFSAGTFVLLLCLEFSLGPDVINAVYLPHFAPADPSRSYLR